MPEAPRITPHPNYDEFTASELDDEVKTIRAQVKLATEIKDKELVGWKQAELGLCFAAMRRLNGGKATIKQAEFWPEFLTSKQLLELKEDPQRWIWDRCLAVRSTSVLVAREYTGKSKFAASLALSVARGITFLNRSTQQCAVGYVYLDGPIDELKENFQEIGIKPEDQVFCYAGRRPDKILEWATESVQLHNIKFLIVDTMQKFFGFEEGSYEERINMMQPFLDIVVKHDFHGLFTCHAAKNADSISALGTVGTEANARTSLYLTRLPENPKQRIFQTQGNSGRNIEATAITNPTDGIIESHGTMEEAKIDALEGSVKDFITEIPGCTNSEIKAAIRAKAVLVWKATQRLIKENQVEVTGTGKPRDPFRHYIAGTIIPEQRQQAQPQENLFRRIK